MSVLGRLWPSACLSLVAFLAVGGPLAATSTHPNHARGLVGFGGSGGGLDNVNLQNGNLTLTVPIGQAYPLSARASYGLALVYNSNIWDIEDRLDTSGEFPKTYFHRFPARHTNAGIGWSITLGRLTSPGHADNEINRWLYLAPDGSQHTFYESLHHGETPVAGVLYTRDGSYLRLKTSTRTIEFPDGTIQTFGYASSCAPATECRYELTQLQDGFGVAMTVGHTTNRWTISDTHGRQHFVDFVGGRVSSVRLQTFNGNLASWNFAYDLLTFEMLKESGAHDDPNWGCPANGTTCSPLSAYALMSVELPDLPVPNTQGDTPSRFWMGAPNGSTWTPFYVLTGDASGRLSRLRLPTLGYLGWDYGAYSFPIVPGSMALQRAIGVTARRTQSITGVVEGTWTYSQSRESTADGSRFTTTAVTDPAGTRTEHYFCSFAPNANGSAACAEWEHALPYKKDGYNDIGGMLAYISTKTLEGATLKQRTFVAFERDASPLPNPSDPGLQTNVNRRVVGGRTRFDDMSGVMVNQFKNSDFDGLGHYRTSLVWSSIDGKPSRTTTTTWNPARGTYPNAGVGSTFSQFGTNEKWVLGTFTSVVTNESGTEIRSEYCFDADGRLTQDRKLTIASGRSTTDLQRLIGYQGANPTIERLWGGDRGAAASLGECSGPLVGAQYRVDYTWQYGVLKTAKTTGVPFNDLDLEIDRWTGLASYARDEAGFGTTYVYDKLSRMIQANPDGAAGDHDNEALTTVIYRTANPDTPSAASVNIRKRVSGPSALVETTDGPIDPLVVELAWTDVAQVWRSVDGLGRTNEERVQVPGYDLAGGQRKLKYDSRGLLKEVSQWGQPQAYWTKFTYDWAGRPTTVDLPDDAFVNLSYNGPRERTRTTEVWNGTNHVSTVTTEVFDRYGNLVQLTEPSNPASGGSDTISVYSYDIANRLSQAATTAGGVTQTRMFAWDNRGLLMGEAHPEISGWTLYTYDAAGAIATREVAGRRLCFTSDRVGRPLTVTDNFNANRACTGTLLKQFTYDSPAAGTWYRGKLASASRFNYFTNVGGDPNFNPMAEIREQYSYEGRGGRPSSRTTTFSINGGAPSDTFVQSFEWTKLGDLHRQVYPQRVGTVLADRQIGYDYDWGFLSRVFSIDPGTQAETDLASINYATNRMISQITHGNGVIETIGLDPQLYQRPASITATKSGVDRWRSGSFAYDRSGNVRAMGASSFGYDKVGRMVSARVATADLGDTGGTPALRHYSYDSFGNLLQLPSEGGGIQSVPVDPWSNRVNGMGASYDAEGNMTGFGVTGAQECAVVRWNCHHYERDQLGMIKRRYEYGNNSGSVQDDLEHLYIYTADDERILDYEVFSQQPAVTLRNNRWTLRGIDGRVVREMVHEGDTWRIERDHVYRGSVLAAGWDVGGNRFHVTTDHLGTPRLFTNIVGNKISSHVYDPFGIELSAPGTNRLKFTGHERDLWDGVGGGDDLDYMHARFYLPLMGRFSSVDPIGGNPFAPQSWNRYSYVLGNPMNFIDPWGLTGEPANQDDAIDIGYVDRVDVVAEWSPPPFSGGFGVPPLAIAADLYLGLRLGQAYYSTRALVLQLNADATQAINWINQERPCEEVAFAGRVECVKITYGVVPIGSGLKIDPNKLRHIFGQARHGLDDVVKATGSREAAFEALDAAAQSAFQAGRLGATGTPGVFQGTVRMAGTDVTVRGKVIDGVFHIGSAWR